MKLFAFCLFFSLNLCIFASESRQPLFIVDGDSVNINVVLFLDIAQAPMEELSGKTNVKMRIAGIDTPEIKQTCEIEEDQSIDCGVLSKDYLQKLFVYQLFHRSWYPQELIIYHLDIYHLV